MPGHRRSDRGIDRLVDGRRPKFRRWHPAIRYLVSKPTCPPWRPAALSARREHTAHTSRLPNEATQGVLRLRCSTTFQDNRSPRTMTASATCASARRSASRSAIPRAPWTAENIWEYLSKEQRSRCRHNDCGNPRASRYRWTGVCWLDSVCGEHQYVPSPCSGSGLAACPRDEIPITHGHRVAGLGWNL